MLVIHWSKQNNTVKILANGIIPSKRKLKNINGVYVYPFSTNKTLSGNWRVWFFNRSDPEEAIFISVQELHGKYGNRYRGVRLVGETAEAVQSVFYVPLAHHDKSWRLFK